MSAEATPPILEQQPYVSNWVQKSVLGITTTLATFAVQEAISPPPAYANAVTSIEFVNDYPYLGAKIYNQATYDWWIDENNNGRADITPTTTDNDETMSPHLYGYRNCTDGVAYWVSKYLGVNTSGWHNGKDWDEGAADRNLPVKAGNSSNIEPGDIAQSDDGKYGHVGFVTKVIRNDDEGVIRVDIAELNKAGDGNFTLATYTSKNSAGNFIRTSSGQDWDHFIDVDGSSTGGGTTPPAPDPVPALIQRPNGETGLIVVAPDKTLDYYFNQLGSSMWHRLDIPGSDAKSTPAAVLRSNGELNIAAQGDDGSLDFYINPPGTNAWHKIEIAGNGAAESAPSMIQRPNGETNIVVQGPSHSLDFYYNAPGSPMWGKTPVAAGGWALSAPSIAQRPTGETDIAVQGPNHSLDIYINAQGSTQWGRIRAADDGTTYNDANPPSMMLRPSGELDLAVHGPGNQADFYYNQQGSPNWGRTLTAVGGYAFREPVMIQRPATGETDLVIVGPDKRLDFYVNDAGSPLWGVVPVSGHNAAY